MIRKLICNFLVMIVFLLIPVISFGGTLKEIDGETLEKMMADGKTILIVDVREPDEFAANHLKGAINLPYKIAKSKVLTEFSPKDRIVFVCHGGPMGHELGTILSRNNYQEVYNLIGGMKKWRGPVVK